MSGDLVASKVSPDRRQWLTLLVMCGAYVAAMIDGTGVAIALPSIQRDLNLDQGELQWIITIYALTLASTLATGGRLGDRFGRLRVFVVGMLLFVSGSLVSGLSPHLHVLLLGRLVEGLGNALMVPVASVLASESLGPRRRGQAMSIYSAVGGASMVLGPLLGGALVQYVGWRAVFFANVPIVVLTLGMLWLTKPVVPASQARSFNYAQAPLLIVALGMLILGLQESHNWLLTMPLAIAGLIAGGAALLTAFVFVQLKVTEPLLDVRLFRHKSFTADAVVLYCTQFAVVGQSAFIGIYFQRILEFSPLHAGLAIVCMPAAWVILSPIAGYWYDRVGVRLPATLGLLLVAAGFLVEIIALPYREFAWLVPALLLIGAGLGLANPQAYTDGMAHVAPEDRGQAYGLLDTIRQVGGAMGMAAVGALVAAQETLRIDRIAAASTRTSDDRAGLAGLLHGAAQGQPEASHALATKWPAAVEALRSSGAQSIADGYGVALATTAVGLILILLLRRGEPFVLPATNHKEIATK